MLPERLPQLQQLHVGDLGHADPWGNSGSYTRVQAAPREPGVPRRERVAIPPAAPHSASPTRAEGLDLFQLSDSLPNQRNTAEL